MLNFSSYCNDRIVIKKLVQLDTANHCCLCSHASIEGKVNYTYCLGKMFVVCMLRINVMFPLLDKRCEASVLFQSASKLFCDDFLFGCGVSFLICLCFCILMLQQTEIELVAEAFFLYWLHSRNSFT